MNNIENIWNNFANSVGKLLQENIMDNFKTRIEHKSIDKMSDEDPIELPANMEVESQKSIYLKKKYDDFIRDVKDGRRKNQSEMYYLADKLIYETLPKSLDRILETKIYLREDEIKLFSFSTEKLYTIEYIDVASPKETCDIVFNELLKLGMDVYKHCDDKVFHIILKTSI